MFFPSEYEITRALNDKGTVFEAVDKESGEPRVLKYQGNECKPLFLKLVKLPKTNNLEYIEKLITYDDFFIAVCEYIDGITLAELLESGRPFTHKMVKVFSAQLCDAAQALRDASIVHRDINPNNILITDDAIVKLIDFNIARQNKGGKKHDTEILGTRGFTAPEQFGFSETNYRADVYSIGMVIKAMADTNSELKYSKEVNEVIEKATKYVPGERPTLSALRFMIKYSIPDFPVNLWNILRFFGFKKLGDKVEDWWYLG